MASRVVISLAVLAVGASAAPFAQVTNTAKVCAAQEKADNHGCMAFCGYKAVQEDGRWACKQTEERVPFPFTITADDEEEYCKMTAETNNGCDDICGYKYSEYTAQCEITIQEPRVAGAPIIGGKGKFRYQYMPNLLQAPAGASLVNCHGLVTDADKNIYLTYQNDGKDKNCLIRWKPDGTGAEFMTGGGDALCSGTPHGLKITNENNKVFLYHANNNQKLTKTTLDGTIVWQRDGFFPGQNQKLPYRPTWFATPPGSDYMYLCDGYGSNNVYAFNTDGVYQNKSWGGRGDRTQHGKFSTNHGCTYDSRTPDENIIIVSDRANSRFEHYHYDPASPNTFEYKKTVDFLSQMGKGTLPCNIRMYPDQKGQAIVPDLAGPVAVMDNTDTVISVVNVSVLLAAEQHKHPHDAIFLANGDMIVATWAPGRISYWKLLPAAEEM